MPFANVTGQIDPSGIIVPINLGTWASLSNSSWSNWTGWVNQPADPVVWNTPVTDIGSNTYFTISTNTQVNGNVDYTIVVSTTGNFAGEETTTTVTSDMVSNVSALYGRYVYLQANVYNQGGITSINSMSFTTSNYSYTIQLQDVDSGQLTANGSSRILPIDGNTIGAIKNISITAHQPAAFSAYVDTGYVDSGYFDQVVLPSIPMIVAKNRMTPTIRFSDYLGNSQDTLFDARIEVVPQLGYLGQNIVIR
jgi:polyisoprenoid-binding protein YceI